MVDVRKYMSSYLKKEDIDAPVQTTISGTTETDLDGEQRLLVYFHRITKPMVLNKTNLVALATAYGHETSEWRGRWVEVYVDPTVTMRGQPVGGVRVRPIQAPTMTQSAAAANQQAPQAPPNDPNQGTPWNDPFAIPPAG